MHKIHQLQSLAHSKQPLYLIATRHVPPTYFGAVPPAPESQTAASSLFAFRDRDLAADIATGLEAYKLVRGEYPALDSEELELVRPPCANEQLPGELEITETSVSDMMRLVRGSGLTVSIMYRDEDDTSDVDVDFYQTLDVRATQGVQRDWLEKSLNSSAVVLLPKPVLPKRYRRGDDIVAKLLLAVWMLMLSIIS